MEAGERTELGMRRGGGRGGVGGALVLFIYGTYE